MVITSLIPYLLSVRGFVCHVDDIPEITITNPDQVTSTYFDPKDPGGDVDRLLSLLDGEHYEVISSLQDRDNFCHRILQ